MEATATPGLPRVVTTLTTGTVRPAAGNFAIVETSTGVRSDAAGLCALARKYGALSIVDCVTSLGGIAVDVAGWDADVVHSGTQKCLSAPPGLSPIALSKGAQAAIEALALRRLKQSGRPRGC